MLNENLNRIIKSIRRMKLEDIIHWSYIYSLSNLSYFNTIQPSADLVVLPWVLDSLFLIKVFVGSAQGIYEPLDNLKFRKLVSSLNEFEYISEIKEQDRSLSAIIPIMISNQTNYQIDSRILFYRSLFFYSECKSPFLRDLFYDKFKVNAKKVLNFYFGLYVTSVGMKDNPNDLLEFINKLSKKSKIKNYIDIFTIDYSDLKLLLSNKHNSPSELLYINYYLKRFCFLNYNSNTFLTYPHNFLSTIAYGSIYLLTDGNNSYREDFGKEVLEDYVYHIGNLNPDVKYISKEIEYKISGNNLKSPDVIISFGKDCLFVESKSTVINSKYRDPQIDGSEKLYIKRYSENLYQLYKGISNHIHGYYLVSNRKYQIENCYGLLINFEDSNINRDLVFNALINKIETKTSKTLSDEHKKWIFNHFRVIDLYEYERIMLTITFNPLLKFFSNLYTDLTYKLNGNDSKMSSKVLNAISKELREFKHLIEDEY